MQTNVLKLKNGAQSQSHSHVRGDADSLWPAAHACTVAHTTPGQTVSAKAPFVRFIYKLGLAADSLKQSSFEISLNKLQFLFLKIATQNLTVQLETRGRDPPAARQPLPSGFVRPFLLHWHSDTCICTAAYECESSQRSCEHHYSASGTNAFPSMMMH